MVCESVELVNARGFHLEASRQFASRMAKYDGEIRLIYEGGILNGKSFLQLLSAELSCGEKLEVVCRGTDEEAMLRTAAGMIRSGFGEL